MAAYTCTVAHQACVAGNLPQGQSSAKSLSSSTSSSLFSSLRVGAPAPSFRRHVVSVSPQAKFLGKAGEEIKEKTSELKDKSASAVESTKQEGRKVADTAQHAGHKATERANAAARETSRATGVEVPGGVFPLVVAIAIPVILGSVIASKNQPQSSDWYRNLRKPSWNPPDWLFGAAWSVLYPIIGYSGWRIWMKGGWDAQSGPLTVFFIQLALNLLWPIICFGRQNLGLALLDIVALFFSIISCIQSFAPVDEVAAQLLWPYLFWVGFAAILNFSLWRMNKDRPSGTTYTVQSAFTT